MRKATANCVLNALWVALATVGVFAQDIVEFVPSDIVGIIRLSPLETAKTDFERLAGHFGRKSITTFFSTELGEAFLNPEMKGVNQRQALAFVMLNPEQYRDPYAIMVPVQNRGELLRYCKLDQPVRSAGRNMHSGTLKDGPVFIGHIANYAVFAGSKKVCEEIVDFHAHAKQPLSKRLSAEQRRIMDEASISFFFNVRQVLMDNPGALDSAKFEMLEAMPEATDAGKDASATQLSLALLESLFAGLQDIDSVCGSLKVSPEGARLAINVVPTRDTPLHMFLRAASASQEQDNLLGFASNQSFLGLVWRLDSAAKGAFLEKFREGYSGKRAPTWLGELEKNTGRGSHGILIAEQGEKGIGPLRLPGLLYLIPVKEAKDRDEYAKMVTSYAQPPLVTILPKAKKVQGILLDVIRISPGAFELSGCYGYAKNYFFLALNLDDARLTSLVGALLEAEPPKPPANWVEIGAEVGEKPNLLVGVSIQTILRMVVEGMKSGPPAETAPPDKKPANPDAALKKVLVSKPGMALGITFQNGCADLKLWTSKHELQGIERMAAIFRGEKSKAEPPRPEGMPPEEYPPGEEPPPEEPMP